MIHTYYETGYHYYIEAHLSLFGLKIKLGNRIRIHDIIVISSLLLFSTVLIIGLLPEKSNMTEQYRLVFINSLMAVPVIIAVYFIIISFRQTISKDYSTVGTSIRTKIILALLFVSVIPSLPIIIISNSIINKITTEIISSEVQDSIDSSIAMSDENYKEMLMNMEAEMKWYSYAINNKIVDITSPDSRRYISNVLNNKKIFYYLFTVEELGTVNKVSLVDASLFLRGIKSKIIEYVTYSEIQKGIVVSRIHVGEKEVLVSKYYHYPNFTMFYKEIPPEFIKRSLAFDNAKRLYNEKRTLLPFFQTSIGIMLLFLSIGIVLLSIIVSFFLSKSITKPVLELANAAESVANGDFSIRLYRKASDELTLLYNSFNSMIHQLDNSRKAMLHLQKLEAWSEVGKKLLHEIKNPLTPIRLSAERIRRRYLEGRSDFESVVLNGTETIIEEVNVLQHILNEFSTFARLPKVRPERNNLNDILMNCIKLYEGSETVEFITTFDETIPEFLIDKILIRQAIINLFKNAIEAMNEKGIITIRTVHLANTALISIKDNGQGIEADDIEKIFEPTFSKKESGTGLGLAIVEKIIIEHYGHIGCNSIIGEGTEFVIELPIKKRHPTGEYGKNINS